MSKIKKLSFDFFFELYENKNILNPFQNVSHSNRELKTISKKNHDYKIEGSNKFFSVFFIPDYFTPQLDYSYYAIKKVSQFFRGYAIDLKEFKTVDEYLKFRFRSIPALLLIVNFTMALSQKRNMIFICHVCIKCWFLDLNNVMMLTYYY